jgi:3-oxoacyl-[acyl-carrier protein] reductase
MEPIVAVVTGGTRGIGLGIAESLLRRGASVAVTYRRDDQAAEAARRRLAGARPPAGGPRCMLLKGDVGDAAAVESHYAQVRAELGPVAVLVNNAGIMPERTLETITLADWEETLRINLGGMFFWSRLAAPDMKARGFGRIVNVTSIAARGGGVVGPHYAASKAGMVGFTRYAARELGPFGITVNAIAPAFIEDAGIFTAWSAGKKSALKEKTVVPRLGEVADVVRAFEYLMDSPFVTGVTLDVNGGAFMR